MCTRVGCYVPTARCGLKALPVLAALVLPWLAPTSCALFSLALLCDNFAAIDD